MRSERFYTLIGLFVGGAIILSIFTALFFYDTYLNEKESTYVMFFNGSLNGLNTTSIITYHGVKIGEVKLIEITENKTGTDIRIPVYVQFFIDNTFTKRQKPLQLLINKGFVASIKQANFITGISTIELIKANTPHSVALSRYKGYLVFPTKNKIEKETSMDETFKAAVDTFHDISKLVNSPNIRETIAAIKLVSESVDKLAHNLDEQTSPLITTFIKTLMNVSSAANSTQNLTDYLSRNPEAILRGKL
jgi:paraquat-inducible protein B